MLDSTKRRIFKAALAKGKKLKSMRDRAAELNAERLKAKESAAAVAPPGPVRQ